MSRAIFNLDQAKNAVLAKHNVNFPLFFKDAFMKSEFKRKRIFVIFAKSQNVAKCVKFWLKNVRFRQNVLKNQNF